MSSEGGYRLVTLRLAARSAHARPVRWLIGVGVTAFALGLGGVPLGPPLGVLLVLVLAVSMAGAPEPDDVRADSVLHLVGASRRHRYGLVVWSALLVLVPGVFVGLVACAAGGALGLTTLPNSWFLLILVGAGVAVTPLAARRRLSAQDGSTGGSRHRPTQAIDAVLLAVGALLIGAAAALPRISRTGLDLSLSLFFAYVGVSVGLFMAMPVLARVPRWRSGSETKH